MTRFLVILLLTAITGLLWLSYDFALAHRAFGMGTVSTTLDVAATISTAALFVALVGQVLLRYGLEWVLRLEPTELQRRLVTAALTFVALTVALAHFGFDFGSILVFSTLITAVIGLSIQPMLGSLVSGLAVDRAVNVGDGVLLNGEPVEIVSLNWRSVVGRRSDGAKIVLPNARLTDNTMEVLPQDRPFRAEARFDAPAALQPHRLQKIVADLIADLPEADPSQSITVAPMNLERAQPLQVALPGESEHLPRRYRVSFSVRHFMRRAVTEGRLLRRLWYALRRETPVVPSEATQQDLMRAVQAASPGFAAASVLAAGEALLYDDGERIALPDRLEGRVCLLVEGVLAEALSSRTYARTGQGLTREASLGRIRQMLAERIGPYADYAVTHAAAGGADLATVCRIVADEIDDQGECAKFLEAASPPPERLHQPGLVFHTRRDTAKRLVAELPLRASGHALIVVAPQGATRDK